MHPDVLRPTNLSAILISVGLAVAAQLALRAGMTGTDVGAVTRAGLRGVAALLSRPAVLGGLTLYGASMLVWLFVLARVPVSVAYAFTGLGVAAVTLSAAAVLGETLTALHLAGIALVCLGLLTIGVGAR